MPNDTLDKIRKRLHERIYGSDIYYDSNVSKLCSPYSHNSFSTRIHDIKYEPMSSATDTIDEYIKDMIFGSCSLILEEMFSDDLINAAAEDVFLTNNDK